MSDHVDELREIYREMDSDEIVDRIRAGTLTSEAQAVALEELASRGISASSVEIKPVEVHPPHEMHPPQAKSGFFVRAWSGKEPLWIVFWVVGIVLNLPLALGAVIHVPVVSLILFVVGLLLRFFWLGCVWRSAFQSSHWLWAILARGYVIVDVAISILVLSKVGA